MHGLLATLDRLQGRHTAAQATFERLRVLFERLGDQTSLATTYLQMARLAEAQGAFEEAHQHYAAELALEHRLENSRGIALAHWGIGNVAYQSGDGETAARHYQIAWDLLGELGDRANRLHLLGQQANLVRRLGDPEKAKHLFQQVVILSDELGDPLAASMACYNLASLAYAEADLAQAIQWLEQAVALEMALGLPDLAKDERTLLRLRQEWERAQATAHTLSDGTKGGGK